MRIYPNPTAEITTDKVCLGDSTLFEVTYFPGDSAIAQYNWSFANNPDSTINDTNFYYTFDDCGVDTNWVELELIGGFEDDNGNECMSDTSVPVILYCLPSITNLQINTVCEGDSSIIAFDTTAGTNPIEIWDWDFDGILIDSSATYVVYENCDDYAITIEISDSAGCSASDSTNTTVLCNTVPEFTLTMDTTCGDETILAIALDTLSLIHI